MRFGGPKWHLHSHNSSKWQCLELGLLPLSTVLFLDSMLPPLCSSWTTFRAQGRGIQYRLVWKNGLGRHWGEETACNLSSQSGQLSLSPMNPLFCADELLHSSQYHHDPLGRTSDIELTEPGFPIFTHLLNKYLFSIYYVSGTILRAESTVMSKTLALLRLLFQCNICCLCVLAYVTQPLSVSVLSSVKWGQ